MSEVKKTNRLEVLDYLRGFFIIVIIVDHLSRWPSLFGYISGQALLWVTAAEGFVIISGLLVGYIRGRKNASQSMQSVTAKLIKRALLLYVMSVIASIIYTSVIWYVHFQGGVPGMLVDTGDWNTLIYKTLTLQHTFVWVYFLTLYAVFLAISPIAIVLMRRGLSKLVIALSLIMLAVGWLTSNQLLQWQALFFIPSVAGYYLPVITAWWKKKTTKKKRVLLQGSIAITAGLVAMSAILALPSLANNTIIDWINNDLFDKEVISIWRLIVAFIWFVGFLSFFIKAEPFIKKYLSWLLLPLGTRSLSAYILHGLAICIISYYTLASDSLILNTLLGITCIIIVWTLVKVKIVQKIIPG